MKIWNAFKQFLKGSGYAFCKIHNLAYCEMLNMDFNP